MANINSGYLGGGPTQAPSSSYLNVDSGIRMGTPANLTNQIQALYNQDYRAFNNPLNYARTPYAPTAMGGGGQGNSTLAADNAAAQKNYSSLPTSGDMSAAHYRTPKVVYNQLVGGGNAMEGWVPVSGISAGLNPGGTAVGLAGISG